MKLTDLLKGLMALGRLERKVDDMKVDLTALTGKVAAQDEVITAVAAAVARLQAAGDPVAQGEIDRLAGVIDANNARLVAVVESVPPDPPPQP